MAVGAAPHSVVLLVLSCLGVNDRPIRSPLYGVEPRDPVILISAIVTLMTVGGLAAGLPAWRASRIDPAVVLRES